MLNAKPKAFARVAKLVGKSFSDPIASFGAVVMSSMATEKTYCKSNKECYVGLGLVAA
jgi:hypothetical protein